MGPIGREIIDFESLSGPLCPLNSCQGLRGEAPTLGMVFERYADTSKIVDFAPYRARPSFLNGLRRATGKADFTR